MFWKYPVFWTVTSSLLEGFWTTVELFLLTLLFALPLGLVICFGSMSKWAPLAFFKKAEEPAGRWGRCVQWLLGIRPISFACRILIWIVRGSPLLLQVLIIYYGPGLIFDMKPLPRFTAALVSFVINYACYFSEIYRGGIQSIPKGQYEAGEVLGMTRSQIFFRVTLLQLVKRIVPPMSNEFITLVKDTSLVRVIAVYEIIWMGESFIKKGMIWPLFYCIVFYLLFNGLLTILFGWIEKKLDYFN